MKLLIQKTLLTLSLSLYLPLGSTAIVFTDVETEGVYLPPYYGTRVHYSWTAIPSPHPDQVIPCPNAACFYGPSFRYISNLNGWGAEPLGFTQGGAYILIPRGTTWGEAASLHAAQFGTSGTGTTTWNIRPREVLFCGGAVPDLWWGHGGTIFTETPSACTIVPTTPVSCTITSSLEIDHGVLNPSQMAGHTATATGRLSCSRAATMQVRVIPPTVDLGGGWISTLEIDGVGDGGTITTSGSSDLSFVSRLSGSSTTTGPLTGTSIVILDAE